MLLCIHRDHKIMIIKDRGAQDGHLDFYTAPELRNRL